MASPVAASGKTAPWFILHNRRSGHEDPTRTREAIEQALQSAGVGYRFIDPDEQTTYDEAARLAARYAADEHGIVVAAGGDGSLNAAAQAAHETGCLFAGIPQGTFNYSGRSWNIPLDAADAVRSLLSGAPQPVRLGQVNERVFLVNASLGLYPTLLSDREAWKKRYGRSRLVALWAALSSLLRNHLVLRLELESDDKPARTVSTTTLFVANNPLQLEQLGVHAQEALQPDRLVALMPRVHSPWALLWLALRGAFGRLADLDQVEVLVFRQLSVKPRWWRPRRSAMRVAIDGEVIRLHAPLHFRVAQPPLQVLVPSPQVPAEGENGPPGHPAAG